MTSLANPPTVIVLASGRGERFVAAGGSGSKLRAPLAGRPVLERTLDAVRASGLPWHVEDAGHPGMGDSIAAAVRATAGAAGWLILPGDLPLVLPRTMRAVAAALAGGVQAAQPSYQGERGHPVGFAAGCQAALAALEGNFGAAPVLRALRAMDSVADLALDDAGVVTDIDTPEALARAEALWRAREAAGAPDAG
ncbi:nucleotidyltransferase family protein [Variovorax sp. DAIF25]|uniref:nucleotidyltransferase family protein n=1 Tax=Variovorax sp. DAIF25 TaxID=3080983 RepID=UPI003D6AD81A